MESIIEAVSCGESIISLCNKYSISPAKFLESFENNSLLRDKFFSAKRAWAMIKVEEIESIISKADTRDEIARARIHADNLRWIASKEARDIYGEKMDMVITNTLDLSQVLNAAASRLAPILHQPVETREVLPLKTQDERLVDNQSLNKEAFDDLL